MKKLLLLTKKVSATPYIGSIKVVSTATTVVGGTSVVVSAVAEESNKSAKNKDNESLKTEETTEGKEVLKPELEVPVEGQEEITSLEEEEGGSSSSGGGGGGSSSSGGGGGSSSSSSSSSSQPVIPKTKAQLFGDWLKSSDATSTYETWRTSKAGVEALKTAFNKSDKFNQELTSWSKGQKRSEESFKEVALKSEQYKEKFQSEIQEQENLDSLKEYFKKSLKYNESKADWISKGPQRLNKKEWSQTTNFVTKFNEWKKANAASNFFENKWKLTNDYQSSKNAYLSAQNQKLNKNNWVLSKQGQDFFDKWAKGANYQQNIINYWKTTQNYQNKLNQWVNVYSSKKTFDNFKNDENIWANEFEKFKNSQDGNKKIEDIITAKDEYINAKNSWSSSGKNQWAQSNDFDTKYNAWRVSDNGRNALKADYLASNDYITQRNDWLLNDYANKRSKNDWAQTNEASNAFNAWKTNPNVQDSLKAHWQSLNDYTTKQNAWINAQASSKNDWAGSLDASNAYNNWKQSQEAINKLKTHYQTQSDYATKRDKWINDTSIKSDKATWLGLDASNANYDAWRVSDSGRNALKPNYLATNDYTNQRNDWLLNDYANKRSIDTWALTSDGTSKYNTWKAVANNETSLKTYWQTQNDFTTKKNAWLTINKPSKDVWKNSSLGTSAYDQWKNSSGGEQALQSEWKTLPDYTTKRDKWINDTAIKRDKTTWLGLVTSTTNYDTWRVTSSGRNALKPSYLATNDYINQRNDWLLNDYTNKRSMDEWSQTNEGISSYTNWKTNGYTDDGAKTYHQTLKNYAKQRDLWITNNKPSRTYWAASDSAKTSYKAHIAIPHNANMLEHAWTVQWNNTGYVAKRDAWIAANPIKRTKNTWINSSYSNSYYNSWRVSSKGIAALSPVYFKTNDYKTKKDTWITNNYTSKRSQTLWNDTDDAKKTYNKWKPTIGAGLALKTYWETKDDYTTKRDAWIAGNKPAKDFWKDTQHASDQYDNYKISASGESALKDEWEDQNDYATKRDTWIGANDAKRDIDFYLGSSFANQDYSNWTRSSDALDAWKRDDNNDYTTKKDTWFNTNFANLDTLEKYKENEYSNWKTQQGLDVLQAEYEATSEYTTLINNQGLDLNDWIEGNKKPTIRSWVLSAGRNRNDFINFRIRRANNSSFTKNDRVYKVVQKILQTYYSDSRLTDANADMYAWNGANWGGRDYKNLLSEKLNANTSLADNTFLGNYKNLWMQKNGIDATNSEYISWLKNEYKTNNQADYDTKFEIWAKAKWLNDPIVAAKDFSVEYETYKENKYTESNGNYQSELSTWLANNNTGINLFKVTSAAITAYNNWVDPNAEVLYKNDTDYQNDFINWRNEASGTKTNGFEFYITQAASDTDYGNWTNPASPKRSYDYWKNGNFNSAYNKWRAASGENILKEEYKKSPAYQKDLKNYYNSKLKTWKQSPEARAAYEISYKKSNAYSDDKKAWANSVDSNVAYTAWKNSAEGQEYLKAAFMKSPAFKVAMEDWFDMNDTVFNEFKHNWFYNEYKSGDQNAFEESLKEYYKTTDDYQNTKNAWFENNKPSKDQWKLHADFDTTYNSFKSSAYGQKKLKALFNKTSNYRSGLNTWARSNFTKRSKSNWVGTTDFTIDYEKWKTSEAGHTALMNDFKASAFYQQQKTAYVNSGVRIKRSFDTWVSNSASNSAYNTWRTTDKAKALSGPTWETTGDGPHYFVRSLNYWFNNYSGLSSSQGWTLNEKKGLFKLSTNASYNYQIALGKWLENKNNGKDIFKSTDDAQNAYDNWNDSSPELASNSNYERSDQFLIDFEAYTNNAANSNQKIGYNLYMGTTDSTSAYNSWTDTDKHTPFRASSSYTNLFNTYVDNVSNKDVYFNDGVSDYDYNAWKSSTADSDYIASNEFATANRNYQIRLKADLDAFIIYFNNEQNLVNSWVDHSWDGKIKELYQEDADFTSDFNTWTNDKSNGLEIYKNSSQATSDYENHSQYQKDLDAYKATSNIGKSDYSQYEDEWKATSSYQNSKQAFISNNLKRDIDFWLNSADSDQDYLDWKNSRNAIKESFSHWKAASDNDYATKRDEWFKNNLKDMNLTSLENEWKQSAQYTNQESKYWGDFDSFVKDSRGAIKEFITAKFRSTARPTKTWFTYGDNTSRYYSSTWHWLLYVLVKSYFPSITSSNRSNAYHGRTNASANLYRSKFYDAIDNDSSWDDYTFLGNLKNLWLKNANITKQSSQYQNWYYEKFYNWLVDNNKIDDAFKSNKFDANINNYEGSLRTWLGDKNKSKDLFKASTSTTKAYDAWDDTTSTTTASESDYTNGNFQYEKDFSTWYNMHKFYLNDSINWENSEDYKAKKTQWEIDQNYNHQTKMEWFNSSEGQNAYNDFKNNNANLEMFKNYYKTTQDYTNNKDAWIATNGNAKENWAQSSDFDTAFNNYVNDASNEADLKTFWKTTQDYADSKNQWISNNYPGITKENWRTTQDFETKYSTWKAQQTNIEFIRSKWEETNHYDQSLLKYRTDNGYPQYKSKDDFVNSIDSNVAYRNWVKSNSSISTTTKNAWKSSIGSTEYNSKKEKWFNRAYSNMDTLEKYKDRDGYNEWRAKLSSSQVRRYRMTRPSGWTTTRYMKSEYKKRAACQQEYIVFKERKYNANQNYANDLRIWLISDKNNGLSAFKSSSIANSAYNAWKRTAAGREDNILLPASDYYGSETNADLRAWWQSDKNENIKKDYYFYQSQANTDFANYQSSLPIPDYDTSSGLDSDFNDFKTSFQTKEHYLTKSASDTEASSWAVTNDEAKYNDSNAFNSDLTTYQDASQANGLSNLENYFFGLNKADETYEDYKNKKLDEAFKASSEYQNELQNWKTTNELTSDGNRKASGDYNDEYLATNLFTNNANAWIDKVETNSNISNGVKTYVDGVYDDNEYNAWTDNGLEPVYKSSAGYQSDFEAWRDKETNGKSNGLSFYLNQAQATTDYNNWIDPNGESAYRASGEFTNHINAWSSNKSIGINTFKSDNQSTTDYNSWTDPSPRANNERGYKNSATYQSDYAAWRDDLTISRSSGLKYYTEQHRSDYDYQIWVDPDGEKNYLNSPEYQSAFETWRDGTTNGKENKLTYYLNSQDGTNDYNSWIDLNGEGAYKRSGEFNNDIDTWSSDKTKGIDVYKASNQSDSDYQGWNDPNPILNSEADYLNDATFANDFATWRDNQIVNATNGFNYYLTHNQSDSDYNSWNGEMGDKTYANSAAFQSDFNAWRDMVTNNLSNGASYYLNQQEAIDSYNNWVDLEGEDDYKTSDEFTNDIDAWSSDKTKGIDVYKASNQSDSDYQGWNDPNPTLNSEADYLNNATFVNDFEAWKDKVVNNQSNGFSYFLTQDQATSDYNNWIATHWVNQYQNDATFNSDFNSWKNEATNNQSNEFKYYLSQDQATNDYDNWIDLNGEDDYKASDEFINDLDTWSQSENSNKNHYLSSNSGVNEWASLLDAEFAKSNEGVTLMNNLKLNYSKDIYKNTAQFQQYYNDWVDPNIRTANKYQLNDTFVSDYQNYYKNKVNQHAAYKNNAQSNTDYNIYLNDLKDEDDYLNSKTKDGDLTKWRDIDQNIVDFFKNDANTLTLFQNFNNQRVRNTQKYLANEQFINDLKIFINDNLEASFEKYLNANLSAWYQEWKDPVGITPDADLYQSHSDYLKVFNAWAAIMDNGMSTFMTSSMAESAFEKTQK